MNKSLLPSEVLQDPRKDKSVLEVAISKFYNQSIYGSHDFYETHLSLMVKTLLYGWHICINILLYYPPPSPRILDHVSRKSLQFALSTNTVPLALGLCRHPWMRAAPFWQMRPEHLPRTVSLNLNLLVLIKSECICKFRFDSLVLYANA